MAHWAEIDDQNIVLRVLVGSNDDPDEGYQWLIDNLGGQWLKTSYNTYGGKHVKGGTPYRKNYAGIGFSYDKTRDAFIPPKPYLSWELDDESCLWRPPVPYPTDGGLYSWNEQTQEWVEL